MNAMTKRMKLIITAATVAAIAAGGAGIAVAAGVGDEDSQETPISGAALERASAAALAHTGGGRVTDTEEATRRATTRSRSNASMGCRSTCNSTSSSASSATRSTAKTALDPGIDSRDRTAATQRKARPSNSPELRHLSMYWK